MLFCKTKISLILLYQFLVSHGSVLCEESDLNNNDNSVENSKKEINNKLVSAYIDFADILSEHEAKMIKTIDEKLNNIINILNEREIKINKTIDEKLKNIMNILNERDITIYKTIDEKLNNIMNKLNEHDIKINSIISSINCNPNR